MGREGEVYGGQEGVGKGVRRVREGGWKEGWEVGRGVL